MGHTHVQALIRCLQGGVILSSLFGAMLLGDLIIRKFGSLEEYVSVKSLSSEFLTLFDSQRLRVIGPKPLLKIASISCRLLLSLALCDVAQMSNITLLKF